MISNIKNIISEVTLRNAVIELLINKIGRAFVKENLIDQKTPINKLQEFDAVVDKKKAELRIFFLGLNEKTNKLHWLFLNDYYLTVKRQDILKLLIKEMLDVIDPTNYFEVPKEPIIYQDKEMAEYEVKIDDITVDNSYLMKKKVGLAILAFTDNKAMYSPFSVLDPRSYKPRVFDRKLGIESTIYLPIEDPNHNSIFGVIIISWDYQKNIDGFFLTPDKSRQEMQALVNGTIASKMTFYKHLTEDIAKSVDLDQIWQHIKAELTTGVEILKALFEMHLNVYMDYLTNFNMYVIEKNIDITQNNKCLKSLFKKSDLKTLHSLDAHPFEYVENFIDRNRNNFPSISHLESLKGLEPFLASLGKKEHFVHMFNCFLLMNVLGNTFIPAFDSSAEHVQQLANIALSHDIGYPIELLEEEMIEFLERFFHKNKYPKFLISKELLFSYSNFLEYYELLREGVRLVFNNDEYKTKIFEDMLIYNFHRITDHAIISALFTMYFNDKNLKPKIRKQILRRVGTPILLHNFYQWKYYYLDELRKIKLKDCVQPDGEKLRISTDCSLFVHLWDRRFSKITNLKVLAKKFNLYSRKCNALKISFDKISFENDTETIKTYSLFLALSDFLQEWGRLLYINKGLASIGLLVVEIKNGLTKNRIKIKTPYAKSDQIVRTEDSTFAKWHCKNPSCRWKFGPKTDFKQEFNRLLQRAAESMEKTRSSKKGVVKIHPYSQALLYLTAHQIWEFINKFNRALDVTKVLKLKWENAESKKKKKYCTIILP